MLKASKATDSTSNKNDEFWLSALEQKLRSLYSRHMQRFLSRVFWTCPLCQHGNSQEVDVPKLSFAAEKMSEMGNDDFAELTCEACDVTFTGHVWSDVHETRFEMDEPRAFEVQGDMPMYEPDPEDLYTPPPPDDPHVIAHEALSQLRALIDAGDAPDLGDPQFRNRLVFSGAIAALEAYFGDTIRNAVERDKDVLVRFATTNEVMSKESLRITMSDVQADPDLLNHTVEERLRRAVDAHLRAVLYHDLNKVIAIYRSALAVDLIDDAEDRKAFFKYMRLRHDCVHRNGITQEGEKHTIFDAPFVETAVERISRVIDSVENRVCPMPPF